MWEEIGVSEILNAFVHCAFAEIKMGCGKKLEFLKF
jgi:hypothetical protein